MNLAVAWIDSDWIYSHRPEQNGLYWIADGWIYGPKGAADEHTHYWISKDGFIWGPKGAPDETTGFYIQGGWIYGPGKALSFAA